jgi:hypothetical protein
MALKIDFKYGYRTLAHFPWGIEQSEPLTYVLPDAYIKVLEIDGTKHEMSAAVLIAAGEKQVHKTYEFTPHMNGDNFIKQAYEHLKTLPEFFGAEDC